MSTYLFHAFQTPETLAKLLAAPEDRGAVIAPLFRSLGGDLLGYWYVLGGAEVYVLFELPDDVAATGMSVGVASSGAFVSPTCTRLMTVPETLAALSGAGGRHGLPRTRAARVTIPTARVPGVASSHRAVSPDRALGNGHRWPSRGRRPVGGSRRRVAGTGSARPGTRPPGRRHRVLCQ